MTQLDPIVEDQAELVAARVEAFLRRPNPTVVAEYLTPAEAAIFINLPVKTLEHWRLRGEGPAFTRVGRHVRYAVEDLRAFMRGERVEPSGGGG